MGNSIQLGIWGFMICLSHDLSVSWFVCLMICLYHDLSVSWFVCIMICLSHDLSLSWFVSLMICLFHDLSDLSVSWFVSLMICLSHVISYDIHKVSFHNMCMQSNYMDYEPIRKQIEVYKDNHSNGLFTLHRNSIGTGTGNRTGTVGNNGVFPKCFSLNSLNSVTKIYDIERNQTCHTATSCVRDWHTTTVPARHMWDFGSLNWAQFVLQWFISFSEFTEFSESSTYLGKTPMGPCGCPCL